MLYSNAVNGVHTKYLCAARCNQLSELYKRSISSMLQSFSSAATATAALYNLFQQHQHQHQQQQHHHQQHQHHQQQQQHATIFLCCCTIAQESSCCTIAGQESKKTKQLERLTFAAAHFQPIYLESRFLIDLSLQD